MSLPAPSMPEHWYALGFFRTQLPNTLMSGSMNGGKLPDPPVVTRGSPSQLALYHGGTSKNEYEELSRIASRRGAEQWQELHASMARKQLPNTHPKPLESYVGKYWNEVGNWFMEVYLTTTNEGSGGGGGLVFAF
ncbi:hypothetical protein B0H63DRAFT_515022 [Podospora didyma]|uniref:Uncharacterized protein n=1 Tax=Podospora didyma TaxID=330526 RepID=A0AAE0K2F2_9PEZI|nr:hypothetical protein B0H63DRAFT_515022 [Podospora didyma]